MITEIIEIASDPLFHADQHITNGTSRVRFDSDSANRYWAQITLNSAPSPLQLRQALASSVLN